jgi:long-chain acyl-CoA synthetase
MVKNRFEEEKKIFNELKRSVLVKGKVLHVAQLLKRAAEKWGNKKALICENESITYLEWYKKSLALTNMLKIRNIKKNDIVLLLFENSLTFYISYFGIIQAGAVVSPLNVFLKEEELAHIIKDAKPKAIVVSNFCAKLLPSKCSSDIFTEDEIDKLQECLEGEIVTTDENDMAVMLYTSGTTGFPKGVMLSSRNIMTNLFQGLSRIGMSHEDRAFAVLPLFHSFAQISCLWAGVFIGVTVVIVPKITKKNISDGLRHKPTCFMAVPAFYGLLCLLKTAPIEGASLFISGGDALPSKISGAFSMIYGRKICNGYGLTEASPIVATDVDDKASEFGCVGETLPYISFKICGENDKEMADGEVGVLWVKGDNIMLGYYNSPAATKEVLQDGWFCTGDLAYINREKKIVICGREKDLIIHRGINVYPQEIENVLLSHPVVISASVVGKEDSAVGEYPVAFVVLRAGQEGDLGIETDLKKMCSKRLAFYKVPRKVKVLHEFPLTSLQKVNKKMLKKMYLDKK